jgi:hypothetical protein
MRNRDLCHNFIKLGDMSAYSVFLLQAFKSGMKKKSFHEFRDIAQTYYSHYFSKISAHQSEKKGNSKYRFSYIKEIVKNTTYPRA